MAYVTDTKEILHKLTDAGEREYCDLLQRLGDEILYRSFHPVRYWWQRALNWVYTGDSTWDGVPQEFHSEKCEYGFEYASGQESDDGDCPSEDNE